MAVSMCMVVSTTEILEWSKFKGIDYIQADWGTFILAKECVSYVFIEENAVYSSHWQG